MKKIYFLLLAAILGTGFSFSAKALDFPPIDPEPGSNVESFSSFTLTIPLGTNPNIPLCSEVTLSNGTTTYAGIRYGNTSILPDYSGIVWNFEFVDGQVATEDGEWTLSFPEGFLYQGNDSQNGDKTAAYTATYFIGDGASANPTAKYVSIDPASGSTLQSFETFTLEIGGYPLRHDDILKEIKFTNGTTTITGASNINMIYGDTYKPVLKLSQAVTEEGEWTLIIPEGAFSIAGGYPLEALTATYTIVAPKILEYAGIEPATESTLKRFSTFKLLLPFDEMSEYQANVDASLIESITMSNGSTTIKGAELVSFEAEWGTPYIVAEFALPEVITEAGEWTLEIPQGLIFTGTWDEANETYLHNGDVYSALTAKYTIDPNAKSKLDIFTLTPASGSEVEQIEEISMVFYEYTAYQMGVETPDEVELTNGKTTVTAYVSRDWNAEEYLTYTIAPEEPITEPGTWTLSVAEGAFYFGAEANAAFKATWTIPTPANYVLTPEPGSTIENANKFTIEFPNATKVEFVGDKWSVSASIGQSWGAPSYTVTEVEGAEHPTFDITITTEEGEEPGRTPMGTVQLLIDEGTFIVDGTPNEEIKALYVVSFDASTDYTQTPEAILVPDDYGYVYPAFVFDEGATVRRVGTITVTLDGEELTNYTSRVEGIYLNITVPATAEDYGKVLKVSIPEGGVLIGGKPSTAIEGTWTIEAPRTYAYELSVNPDETATDLSTITIIFPEAKSIEFFEYWNASLRNSTYTYYQDAKGELLEGDQVGIKLTFFPAPKTAGKYTLTLREGSLTLDGAFASPEVKAVYNFDPVYILTPESGSTLENLNEFTLEFPKAKEVEFAGDRWALNVFNGGYSTPGYNVAPVEGAAHPTFKFTLDEDASRAPMGSYTLLLDEGAFLVDGQESEEIVAYYTVSYEVSTDFTQTPETTLVDDGYGWVYPTLIFEEGASVRLNGSYYQSVTITIGDRELTAGSNADFNCFTENNYFMTGVRVSAEDYGKTLTLKIAEGGLLIGGNASPAIEAQWDVVGQKEFTFIVTPSPEETVDDLSTVTVVFPEAKTVEFFESWNANLRGPGYRYTQDAKGELIEGDQIGIKLTFTPAPEEAGAYTFTLREGSLTLDGVFSSPEVRVVYNFDSESGVEGIAIDAESTAIFNLQGIRINTTWSELAPGIYIVNGKKVAKK